jgi:hypothetical protein
MGKTSEIDWAFSPREATPKRSREEVLRDVKLAIAQGSNYGREARQQGSNPYDSRLGRPQRNLWNGRRPA